MEPVLESKHVQGASLETSIIVRDATDEHPKRLASIRPCWERVELGHAPHRSVEEMQPSGIQPATCRRQRWSSWMKWPPGGVRDGSEAGANASHHVSRPPVLRYGPPMLHTISPHSGGCAGAAAQDGAVIGPAAGAASQPISPFLLLFAPRLAVTGCRVIGQERACPLRFTLMSLRVQSPILETPPPGLAPALPLPPVSSPPSPRWAHLWPR